MYRGIKGTFVYACDKHLRAYLKRSLPNYQNEIPLRIVKTEDVKPFINAVPVYDLKVAAGEFSPKQNPNEFKWIELPPTISHRDGMFVCKVIGESMNQRIPNGSWCLFKKDEGGSRNGLITLIEMSDYTDPDFGSNYTIKEYRSKKVITEGNWGHEEITLIPKSNLSYEPIRLINNDEVQLKVVGIFMSVLE